MTFRDELREVALDQQGYVTTRDAQRLKIPSVELRKLASRGKLENVARGVYRFPDVPGEHGAEYAAAVLSAGDGAYLTGLSVLALHELAQLNPRTIDVGTDKRVRLTRPGATRIVQQTIPESDRTVYDGIPSMTVARAIRDAIPTVMTGRLATAAEDARSRGLLTRSEYAEIIDELNAVAATEPNRRRGPRGDRAQEGGRAPERALAGGGRAWGAADTSTARGGQHGPRSGSCCRPASSRAAPV